MDIDRFITLQTVVEEGSFVRAANKLCCTQSTVSYHIRELEQELSVQLFEKIGRRMLLTDAGRTVLPLSKEVTQGMEKIRRALHPDDLGGELRLAMGETLLAYRIPNVLKRFKALAPNVLVSLRSLNCDVILDMLLTGGVDMGIFYSSGNEPSLIMEKLGTVPLTLAASPHLSQHVGEVDFMRPHQRLPVSLIINESQCVYRLMIEQALHQRNIVLDTVIELWSIESIKQCVEGNLGVTYLPKFCLEKELQEGLLQELPLHPEPETITAVCAYHVNKCLNPAAKLFLRLLQDGF